MKLSKQERIGLMIIVAVIILALGGFLLFKPKVEEVIANKKAMTEKQAEFDKKKAEADKMEPLKQQILAAYEEGSHLADMFFDEMSPYETDNMLREFLANRSYTKPGETSPQEKANVLIEELTVSESENVELEPSFYTPTQNTYPLKEFATQGGTTPTTAQMRNAMLQAALGEAQTIGASTITLGISAIDPDELIKFADELNNFVRDENGNKTRKALMASGIEIEYNEITKKYEDLIDEKTDEAKEAGLSALESATGINFRQGNSNTGTNVPTPVPGDDTTANNQDAAVSDYVYTWETTLTFYSIERMQDPTDVLNAQDIRAR